MISFLIGILGPILSYASNRNPHNCIILNNWVFENFILADKPFAKAEQSLVTCVSVNNSLYGKLVSLLEFPILIWVKLKFDFN